MFLGTHAYVDELYAPVEARDVLQVFSLSLYTEDSSLTELEEFTDLSTLLANNLQEASYLHPLYPELDVWPCSCLLYECQGSPTLIPMVKGQAIQHLSHLSTPPIHAIHF